MNLLAELKRRKVFRVGAAYAVAAWALAQVADLVLENTAAPDWVMQSILLVLALGFPIALILAWAFEVTPDGVHRTLSTDHDGGSVRLSTGDAVLIVLMIAMIGIAGYQLVLMPHDAATVDKGTTPGPADVAIRPSESIRPTPDDGATSIAVLAFENMSPDPDNAYFAEGIAEEILNLLAGVEALSVASRTSAFSFKGKDTPVPEIARALDVRYVLEGSVRRAGDQVRVTAQLIDAGTDRHLWSETFDRKLDDVFAIQDEIAGAIGEALEVELLGSTGQVVKAESIDPDVYDRFLEARDLLRQRTGEAMREANRMLIEVVEAEPEFARAHVVLGEAYLLNRQDGRGIPLVPESVARSQARLHAETARRLNPELSGIDLILGFLEFRGNDNVAAFDHYSRAMALEPDEPRPYHWRGWQLCGNGLIDRGVADLSRALELDPKNPNVFLLMATCLLGGDNPQAARVLSKKGLELGAESVAAGILVRAELALGNREAAIELIQGMLEGSITPERAEFLRQVIRSLDPDAPQDAERTNEQPPDPDWALQLALNRYDEYLEALAGTPLFAVNPGVWSVRHSAMRRDPRFPALMEKIGAFDLWRELGPPADCRVDGDGFTCGHGHEPVDFRP